MRGVFSNHIIRNDFQNAHDRDDMEEMKRLIKLHSFTVLDIVVFQRRNGKSFDQKNLYDLIVYCLNQNPEAASYIHGSNDAYGSRRVALDFVNEIPSYSEDVFKLIVNHTHLNILNGGAHTGECYLSNTLWLWASGYGLSMTEVIRRMKYLIIRGINLKGDLNVVRSVLNLEGGVPPSSVQEFEDFVECLIQKGASTVGVQNHPLILKHNNCKKSLGGVFITLKFLDGLIHKDLARYVLIPLVWSTRRNEEWL